MITLLPFYKELNESKVSKKLQKRIDSTTFNYRNALDLMEETFRKNNPNGKFVVQTDLTTPLNFQTFRTDLSGANLMESIVLSHNSAVSKNQGKLAFVGCDHLICGNLEKLFDEDFDIATCINGNVFDEQHRTNIINLVFVNIRNTKRQKRIINFFQEQYSIFKNFEEKDKLWWGDQKSLSVLLETKNIISDYYTSNGTTNTFNFDELKIKLFKYGDGHIISSKNFKRKNSIILDQNLIIDFAGYKENFNNLYSRIMEK